MSSKILLLTTALCYAFVGQVAGQTTNKEALAKNAAYVALLFSYSKTKKENSKTLLENVVHSNSTKFSIRSGAGYFVARHLALGLNFDYGSEKENAESVNAIGPNTIAITNLNTYTFTPFMRNYFSVGVKDKFFLFTQTGLEYSFGNGSDSTVTGNSSRHADIKNYQYGIAFTPGLIFLVRNGFAFEVNVGVLGFSHSKQTTTPDNGEPTVVQKTDFDLSINLLSLGLGISYYF